MTIRKSILQMVACGFLANACLADDIDLYVGGEQVTGAETNVLIFLDNSANWSNASGWPATQGEAQLDALKAVIDTLNESVNVGVMMHTRTGSTSGAYVRFAIRPMSPANRTRIKEVFDDIKSTAPNAPQDKVAQSADGDHAMEEVFRYFNSKALGFTAARDAKEDYTDNTAYYDTGGSVSAALAAKSHPATSGSLGQYAYATSSAVTYSGPSTASDGCAKNYLIWIGNSSLDGSTDAARLTAAATLVGETATTTQVPVTGNSQPGSVMIDEWARFMNQYGVKTTIDDPRRSGHKIFNKIITYTVDTFPAEPAPETCVGDTSGGAQQIGQHYIMQSVASQGAGKCYPAANTSQLSMALQKIFAEIQAVNSVFASASLPVSVNTQGTYENQVYIGMFRPDAAARPRWPGNLKEYKFGRYCDSNSNDIVDAGEAIADSVLDVASICSDKNMLKLFLADRNNNPAIDQTTGSGFIDLNAISYWTTAENPGFWTFFPDVNAGSDDSPDGPLVERGAAAFKLRNQFASGRNVYTCLGECLTSTTTSLDTQLFVPTNSAVTTKLDPGSKTVTGMVRNGNVVTATTSTAHGFGLGDTITISGPTTPAEYLGAFAITGVPTTTTLTYSVAEKPTDDTANARVSAAQTAHNVDLGVTVSNWTTGAATATATSNPGSYVSGDDLLVSGGTYTYLNSSAGGTAVSAADTSSFSYPVNVPVPTTPATAAGTSRIGAATYANASIQRMENLVVVNAGNNAVDGAVVAGSTSVTIAGATPSDYNVTRTIENKGTGCNGLISGWSPVPNNTRRGYYCFRLFGLSGSATVQKISNPVNVTITRPVGGQTATATVKAATDNIPVGDTLTISNSIGYDGSWTMAGDYAISTDGKSFTFGPVTLSPAQPSGTYTATPGSGSTTVAATNLVNWVRGMDVYEDENQNGSKTDVRASVHADVLHSRPLILNYGSGTGIVGFYGSNDGLLHAIKGGTADSDGYEIWSFIPDEFVSYSKLSRLYRNEPLVRFPNLQCGLTPTPSPRDYFWDGVISGYQSPDGTSTTAPSESLIFATMRRGGRSVYAFDVTTPANPKSKWRITNATTGFSDLGQTWSEVKPITLKGTGDGIKAVVFGAGYDAAEEDKPAGSVRSPTVGRGVYVVDMDSGERIAFLQPPTGVKQYSFAADVTPIDSDGDGFVDQIYAVDSGGNMFRFDAVESDTTGQTWRAYHLAKFGDLGNDGGLDARKFLFAPAVTFYYDPATVSYGVLVMAGSGDRDKPLKNPQTVTCPSYYDGAGSFGNPVEDRFYAIVDTVPKGATADQLASIGVPFVESNLLEVNTNPDELTGFSFSSTKKGWYIKLNNETDTATTYDEEKTVNAAQLVGGVLYFATNTPQKPDKDLGICSNLGQALAYAVDPLTGLPAYNRDGTSGLTNQSNYASLLQGGGLSPTVTSGVIMIGGQPYYGVIGAGGTGTEGQSLGGGKVVQTIPATRRKIYWYFRADE